MWLKLLGSFIILIAGSSIGFRIAASYHERPRQIRHLIGCLASLKSHINYTYMPLTDALILCTRGTAGPIAQFLQSVAALMETDGCLTPQEAIENILKTNKRLALGNAETEVLMALGANLGHTSREEQEKYLEMIQYELHKIEQEAIQLRNQNTKMFQYLGICGSLAIVILLF